VPWSLWGLASSHENGATEPLLQRARLVSGSGPGFGRDYVDEAFNSGHTSRWTHFLFADGSVRGYTKNVHPDLRAHLGTRSDGLVLDPDVEIVVAVNPDEELVKNGSFEQPSTGLYGIAVINGGGGGKDFYWLVESGNFDVLRVPRMPKDGMQFMDLNGVSVGTISQILNTVAGTEYMFQFYYSENYFTNVPKTCDVDVLDGSGQKLASTTTVSRGNASASELDWQLCQIRFTATGANTKIRFTSTYTGRPDRGVFLDHVSVKAYRP